MTVIQKWVRQFAEDYAPTEAILAQRILESPFVHVDDTQITIAGVDHYAWVFTDGKHVLFKLSGTREASVVREFLAGYGGVLISDFFPGFDSLPCRQQKCWVHLIRDLNNDLWIAPFDTEFEAFVCEVRDLIVPIIEAARKYGLKRRHLNRFKKQVARFYKRSIDEKVYKSKLALTYQKRFRRYRESLFTFIEHDSIPWNNNAAESGIRELAIQRKISGAQSVQGARDYLLLLGIAQTCRFQEKSFLKFLLSGEKDIDKFKAPKRLVTTEPVGKARSGG